MQCILTELTEQEKVYIYHNYESAHRFFYKKDINKYIEVINMYLKRDNKTIYLKGNIEEVYYTASKTRVSLKEYLETYYKDYL